jgi:predicted HicB family RNase H-like nuclease
MKKKNFKMSFNDLLEKGEGKKKEFKKETKVTFVVRCDQLDKIRAISYMERKMMKNILEETLSVYINDYETTNGSITLPKK